MSVILSHLGHSDRYIVDRWAAPTGEPTARVGSRLAVLRLGNARLRVRRLLETDKVPGGAMLSDDSTFERHYRIGELAEMWSLGRETVRLLIKDEPGVIRVRLGRKKAHTSYSVPASVAVRIHTRLLYARATVR